jgi:NAD(P)-dependent dehydrogenase (short-subunit alcohol dehydrogenase family)
VASLDPARNKDAVGKLKSMPNARVIGVPTDLTDAAAIERLFKTALAEFGRLDILVNNATNVVQGSFFQMDEAAWDRAFENKLRGTVRCIRLAVPVMRERKWGRIVNLSGGAAWTPQLGAIATGMNNAAVQNLTVALANELGRDGITVNAVVPTAVRTDRHDKNIRDEVAKTGKSEAEVLKPRVAKIPLGRMGTADEIANIVVFLASERASFVNGSAWAVDGGVSARL